MQFKWPVIEVGTKGWTAVDANPDGSVVGVSVRRSARSGSRPQVVKCARRGAGVSGVEALAELARKNTEIGILDTDTPEPD